MGVNDDQHISLYVPISAGTYKTPNEHKLDIKSVINPSLGGKEVFNSVLTLWSWSGLPSSQATVYVAQGVAAPIDECFSFYVNCWGHGESGGRQRDCGSSPSH